MKFSCVELDGFRFDFERMAFWKNGEPIELSKTEQKLLRLLVENRGQTVSRGALIDRIWTDGADFVDEYHGKQVPAGKKSVTIRLTIGSLENGRYNPSILLAFKLARYFDCAIEDIFIYEEDEGS